MVIVNGLLGIGAFLAAKGALRKAKQKFGLEERAEAMKIVLLLALVLALAGCGAASDPLEEVNADEFWTVCRSTFLTAAPSCA